MIEISDTVPEPSSTTLHSFGGGAESQSSKSQLSESQSKQADWGEVEAIIPGLEKRHNAESSSALHAPRRSLMLCVRARCSNWAACNQAQPSCCPGWPSQ